MNFELLFTLAINNIRSYLFLWVLNFTLIITAVDLNEPRKSILVTMLFSILISLVAIAMLTYYNSDLSRDANKGRFVKNIKDKKKIFRKIAIVSYIATFLVLLLLYFSKTIVAPYFIYTGPFNLIVLFIVINLNDIYINSKYDQLKSMSWVFDYKRNPKIRTMAETNIVSMSIFDENNNFIYEKEEESINVENFVKKLPPGTIAKNKNIKTPNFKNIKFDEIFNYNSVDQYKTLLLKKSNEEDIKKFRKYINVLDKYSKLYNYFDKTVKCCRVRVTVNSNVIDNYVEDCDYIKKFSNTKDVELASLSIKMNNNLAKLSVKKFLESYGKAIKDYDIKKEKNRIILFDKSTEKIKKNDVTYLQEVMSLNIEEYKCVKQAEKKKDEIEHFTTIQDFVKGNYYKRKKEKEKEKEKNGKSLYFLNFGEISFYVFKEDFSRLAELDKFIISNFINKDIMESIK
ncbi:hypothetical protein [Helicovermis profundi]|uniref:Gustatory receptor n=1 Tax=Helicovermis profundi TaxID=3065157 RepID=A0AAU9EH18_9FIRM|nr:hypothetical protein HLPR_10890 [Clostridia bacterium S502]